MQNNAQIHRLESTEVPGASSINCNSESQVHLQSHWIKITDSGCSRGLEAFSPTILFGWHTACSSVRNKIWGLSVQSHNRASPVCHFWAPEKQGYDWDEFELHSTNLTVLKGHKKAHVQAKKKQWIFLTAIFATSFAWFPVASSFSDMS